MRGILAITAAALSTAGQFAAASLGAGIPRFVQRPPRPAGEPRNPKVAAARRDGRLLDPYFGIKSKGRRGAWKNASANEAAFRKTRRANRFGRGEGRVFADDHRQHAFLSALASGLSRNAALKLARRVR